MLVWYRFFFFFKQKTAYEMRISDWSSDVCSSDLQVVDIEAAEQAAADRRATQMTVDDKRNALSVKCQLTRDQMRQVRRLTFNAIRNDIDAAALGGNPFAADRKSTRLNSSH